ncbi:MAG: HAD-IB family hydrolase [Steroidobacteraceae bacterium]|nr:HAD-IB family hydrolase [Steroidobacteraceae bacterium]
MRIALFDLDGTITYRDTLLPFVLGKLAQRPWQLLRLLGTLPAIVRYGVDRDRGALKGALLHATMRGQSRSAIEQWATEFAAKTVATQVMPGARAAIERHRAAGDRLILMSASVDLYVPRLGALLGFDAVICTQVRWFGDELDGRLASANCRGPEKVSQLQQLMSQHPGIPVTAYGNSISDVPHLQLADTGVFVNAPPRARAALERQGLACENWR